ncbi:MAG: hypothetical protein M4D80_33370 [Myxococcota bacterium]|nr:hypothetical protein [Myxococcota bacterium]
MISIALITFAAACGGGGGGSADAAIDTAPQATIVLVDPCPATADATFMTLAEAFSPTSATITQGQVVKYVTTATHPVKAQPGTEATLAVPEQQTRCFRFTATGTYKFQCAIHSYAGTLTVN